MRPRTIALGAVALLLLAACGSADNAEPAETPTTTAPTTTTPTSTPSPLPTTAPAPAPTESPLGDTGILRTDGIGPFGFGSAADEVEVWLINQLGSPDAAVVEPGQGGWPLESCTERRFVYWVDAGLTVGFTDLNSIDTSGLVPDCDTGPHLAGWYVIAGEVPWFAPDHGGKVSSPQTLSLTTAEGIGLGSGAGDLREAYPTVTFGEQGVDTYDPAVFRVPDTMWGRVEWNEASDIQKALNEHGADLVVDGILGPRTVAALVEFQTSNDIKESGAVGPRTLAELDVSVPDGAPIVYLAAGRWVWDY
jgi:hypothetical protein